MSEPLLSVRNLNVFAGSSSILTNISFDISQGEALGLFGDSGSGKTTILHSLFGLQHQDFRVEGQITFEGKPIIRESADIRSKLGMSIVLQDLGLFDDRSIFENIAYPLRRRGLDEETIARDVNATLSFLQISELAAKRPLNVSGGQRQRVALARALVYRPKLLLLDEPLRGLQERLKLQFLAFIRAIGWQEMALIFVTHERDELELIADTVITISNGKNVRREQKNGGGSFKSLASTMLMPGGELGSAHCEGSGFRLLQEDHLRPGEQCLEVDLREWRPISHGRCAALVRFSNGEPGWLLFDSMDNDLTAMPLGLVQIAFTKTGG
jgi:ABC-type sulfate/molybdate transport systems ATPase subunit